jgi:hypothetical protein
MNAAKYLSGEIHNSYLIKIKIVKLYKILAGSFHEAVYIEVS